MKIKISKVAEIITSDELWRQMPQTGKHQFLKSRGYRQVSTRDYMIAFDGESGDFNVSIYNTSGLQEPMRLTLATSRQFSIESVYEGAPTADYIASDLGGDLVTGSRLSTQ